LGVFEVLPRTFERECEDLAGVPVALDRDARLETRSDHPEPRLHVNLKQLEIDALLIHDEGQVFLCTVQRCWNAWDRRKFCSHILFLLNVAITDW
jgi:hypothetical protein